MAQVSVTINGRAYRMACEDGQENHLVKLAKNLDDRIVDLRGKFGLNRGQPFSRRQE
jgi:cell division protein ZapA